MTTSKSEKYRREHYIANREKVLKDEKIRYAKNREKVLLARKVRHCNCKRAENSSNKKRYNEHKDAIMEARNPETCSSL